MTKHSRIILLIVKKACNNIYIELNFYGRVDVIGAGRGGNYGGYFRVTLDLIIGFDVRTD
jgi:hypothetical protein